jgi:hypothetical protein
MSRKGLVIGCCAEQTVVKVHGDLEGDASVSPSEGAKDVLPDTREKAFRAHSVTPDTKALDAASDVPSNFCMQREYRVNRCPGGNDGTTRYGQWCHDKVSYLGKTLGDDASMAFVMPALKAHKAGPASLHNLRCNR